MEETGQRTQQRCCSGQAGDRILADGMTTDTKQFPLSNDAIAPVNFLPRIF